MITHAESGGRSSGLTVDADDLGRSLTQALNSGAIELPGFPEVSMRVQKLLADDAISSERIVRIISAEPMLATRLMSLANSAAMNGSNTPITDLRNAVARVGFDSLRAVAVAYAVAQLRRAREYLPIAEPLSRLWAQSVSMAAKACVVAKHTARVGADKALFTGLVSGVGRIYILTHLAARSGALNDEILSHRVMREWHIKVAAALLRHWSVADEIVEAVETHERLHNAPHTPSPLADVLAVAALLEVHQLDPATLADVIPDSQSAARLGLSAGDCTRLLQQADSEVAALRAALGH